MVSPELLRRFRYFAGLNENQLKEIAMISEETSYQKGETIFEEQSPADNLFILQEGSVDLLYKSEEEYHPTASKEFYVGQINPGDSFGISALVEPYTLSATARASQNIKVIMIDAIALRALLQQDSVLYCKLMSQTAKSLKERLGFTRVQLAAALAK